MLPDGTRPLTVTVKEAMRLSGLGLTTIYKLIREGNLEISNVGARRLITFASLEKAVLPSAANAPRRGRPRKAR